MSTEATFKPDVSATVAKERAMRGTLRVEARAASIWVSFE